MATDQPLVHVVIVNYDGKSHLEYCLPSILGSDYQNFEVVLVDNDSSDGSIEYVTREFPSVTVIELDENRGWAGGNNVGVAYAQRHDADYVFLANNDIRVHPGAISTAIKAAENVPEAGFIGFDVYGTVRPVPIEEYETACEEWDSPDWEHTTDFVDGMAMFVPTEVFSQIGTFDETYFLYAEETDFEIRGEKAGYDRIRTNVPVWHYSSGTTRDIPVKAAYYAIRNHIRLAIKHESATGVLQRILSLYYTGCWPLFDGDMENRIIARRRPKGVFFNFFLITYCLLWNVVSLPETLLARQRDERRIWNTRLIENTSE